MQRRSKPSGRINNIYFGVFLGLIFPMAGYLLLWLFRFSDQYKLADFWEILFYKHEMSAVLSLSLLMNAPVFFLNTSNNRYRNAYGILGATLFYGLLIIIFKFL